MHLVRSTSVPRARMASCKIATAFAGVSFGVRAKRHDVTTKTMEFLQRSVSFAAIVLLKFSFHSLHTTNWINVQSFTALLHMDDDGTSGNAMMTMSMTISSLQTFEFKKFAHHIQHESFSRSRWCFGVSI